MFQFLFPPKRIVTWQVMINTSVYGGFSSFFLRRGSLLPTKSSCWVPKDLGQWSFSSFFLRRGSLLSYQFSMFPLSGLVSVPFSSEEDRYLMLLKEEYKDYPFSFSSFFLRRGSLRHEEYREDQRVCLRFSSFFLRRGSLL